MLLDIDHAVLPHELLPRKGRKTRAPSSAKLLMNFTSLSFS